jgi:hypothetical protein
MNQLETNSFYICIITSLPISHLLIYGKHVPITSLRDKVWANKTTVTQQLIIEMSVASPERVF